MIPLEALQALDSIDRKGSFAAAAEELFRVPSAITYTIKKLEEQLDIKLFDRDRQRARLTPTGKLVLEQGREILRRVQRLEEQAKQIDSGWESELRVVVDTLLPAAPLWPLLQDLQQQHDWLNIQVLEESLSGAWEALVNQRADLVVGVTGDEPAGGHWHKHALGHVQMAIYCSTEHPASQLTAPIKHEQLQRFTHVVVNDSARNLPHRNVGLLGLKQILAVPTMSYKLDAVIAGMGISHLPDHLALPAVAQGLLKRLVINADPFPQTLFMVWPKHNTGKACDWLRQQIIERNIY